MSRSCFYEGCINPVSHSLSWTTLIDGKIEKQLVCWMCEPCFQGWLEIFRESERRGVLVEEQ